MNITRTLIILWILLSLTSNINLEPMIRRSLASGENIGVQVNSDPHDLSTNRNFYQEHHQFGTVDSEISFFFPFIAHYRQRPDIRSPFSLQIAALHQVLQVASINETSVNKSSDGEPGSLGSANSPFGSLKSALKDSGADWSRVRVEWEIIEPNAPISGQPPEYNWQFHDDGLRIVAEADVRIIATLSDSPGWAADEPCAPIYADRLDEFSRFINDLVHRYKGHPYYIEHWELVNEPDSNRYSSGHLSGHGCWAYDGDQYAQMLAVAYKAIKKADPKATVLMGGIAYDWFEEYGGPFNRYFSDDVMENGGGAYLDALNLHFYTDFSAEWDRWNPDSADRRYDWIPAPTCGIVDDGVGTAYDVQGFDVVAKATHFQNRMNACYGLSKPVWLTEVGAHGYPEDQNSLDSQARYVIKVYARSLSAGVKNITWFSLDRPPYDRFEQSLLNSDFSPKPAYLAYQTLASELDGFYEYSHDRNRCYWDNSGVSCYVEAYIFKDDSQNEKTVAWGSSSLKFSTHTLRVVDRNGKETIIRDGSKKDEDGIVDGKVQLDLSEEPVIISTR